MAEKNKEDMVSGTLEETFQALETVMEKMSDAEISLEESFSLYHQGIRLLKECNDKIDTVEKKMLLLDEEGDLHEF